MKAAVLEHYGAPGEFAIKELPTPDIKQGQILIRNRASSVNPVDALVRQGKTRLITGLAGEHLIGSDFSGIVIATRSSRFNLGDAVFGLNNAIRGGSYAEIIVADEDNACPKPINLSFTEAAALPLVSLTAWQGMVTQGNLKQNDRVLILGCTGGVGTMAVQIAKSFHAVITGTCSQGHVDFARAIGVHQTIVYNKQQIPKDQQFDLIFDASGNYTISDMKDHLTDKAMFVSTRGGTNNLKGVIEAVIDIALQKRMKIVMEKPNPHDLNEIRKLAEAGKLRPYITRTFPLEQVSDAHRMMENGGFTGKIVIDVRDRHAGRGV